MLRIAARYLIEAELEELPAGGDKEREAESAEQDYRQIALLLVALLHGGRELIAHEHRLSSAEQVEYLIPHEDGIIEVQERAAEGCEQQSDGRDGLAIGRELAQAVFLGQSLDYLPSEHSDEICKQLKRHLRLRQIRGRVGKQKAHHRADHDKTENPPDDELRLLRARHKPAEIVFHKFFLFSLFFLKHTS